MNAGATGTDPIFEESGAGSGGVVHLTAGFLHDKFTFLLCCVFVLFVFLNTNDATELIYFFNGPAYCCLVPFVFVILKGSRSYSEYDRQLMSFYMCASWVLKGKKKRTLFRSTLLLLDFFCLDRMSCVRNAVLRFLLIFIGLFNWSGFFFSFFSSRKMSRMLHFANSFCSGVSNRSGGKYYRPCCHAPVFRHHLHHRLCLSIIKWFLSSVPREIKFLFN